MTTSVKKPPVGWRERLSQARQALFIPGDLSALLITLALLALPVLSLQAAAWPVTLNIILPVTLLSVVMGFLLGRSRYNELVALIISSLYGFSAVFLLAALTEPGGGWQVFVRATTWLTDAFTGGINQDELVFTLLVAALFWFLGYNAAWHVFRIDRVWRVVLPPGLILVTNTVFYSGDNNLELYLVAFMFLALLLVARSSLDAREWEWYTNGVRVPRKLRQQFLRVGAALALIVLAVAWLIPSGNLQERLDSFQDFLRSDPIVELSDLYSRLFAPIDAEGPTSADYYGGDSLELSGAISLGDQEVLYVSAPTGRRYYWRARVFDTYELGRWTPGATHRLRTGYSPLDIRLENDQAREEVRQTFTIGARASRLVYTAPQPSQIDLPTTSFLSYATASPTPDRQAMDSSAMNISAVRPQQVLSRGTSYTATSMMSVATADQLRAASPIYPDWIAAHPQYLRDTPNVVSERVARLAAQIVAEAGATNAYDRAKAIERWLRSNITYNEIIPSPPVGADPIEWFLFELRQGYCNYYATAMVAMLRSQGIAARMAAGFAEGEYDPVRGQYIVRERDAHTWVEAYFTGFGWIEFEPTQAQAPLNREGDSTMPEVAVLPFEAEPTPTLTPDAPPPTPIPTPTPEPPDNAEDQTPPDIPPTPTITPTFTPTPTPTPVILPTQPAPVNPEPRNPLSFILPALGLVLLGVLVLLLIVALLVLLYWWWEWRGMRGLSPISRAYARLERYLGLIGLRFGATETPEERRRHISRDLPSAERPVTAITRLYTMERYGPGYKHPADEQQRADSAEKAWGDARGRILRRWLRRLQFWRRGGD